MLISNRFVLRLKSLLRSRFPGLLIFGSRLASRTVLFGNERRYLRGVSLSDSELPSVLFFTTIRAASQFIDGGISRLYAEAGGVSLRLSNYFFHACPDRISDLSAGDAPQKLFRDKGYYFGALPAPGYELDPGAYRTLVVVRDPRDVIVSFFYSLAHAHTPSDRKFVRDSREAKEKGIEWFVRQEERINMVSEPLRVYADTLWGKDGVLCWRYEDLMEDFPSFARSVEQHVAGGAAMSARDRWIEEQAKSRPPEGDSGENLLAHRRSGKSGSFRSKLSAEAVDLLNDRFQPLLASFGYAD